MNRPGTPSVESERKVERVDEIVVDSSIDHIDALRPGGGPHVDDVVVDEQVAALDQFDAHLARQKRVLEIGGVEDAGRQQHDGRVGPVRGRQAAQRGEQLLAVLIDRAHVVALNSSGKTRFITCRLVSM